MPRSPRSGRGPPRGRAPRGQRDQGRVFDLRGVDPGLQLLAAQPPIVDAGRDSGEEAGRVERGRVAARQRLAGLLLIEAVFGRTRRSLPRRRRGARSPRKNSTRGSSPARRPRVPRGLQTTMIHLPRQMTVDSRGCIPAGAPPRAIPHAPGGVLQAATQRVEDPRACESITDGVLIPSPRTRGVLIPSPDEGEAPHNSGGPALAARRQSGACRGSSVRSPADHPGAIRRPSDSLREIGLGTPYERRFAALFGDGPRPSRSGRAASRCMRSSAGWGSGRDGSR